MPLVDVNEPPRTSGNGEMSGTDTRLLSSGDHTHGLSKDDAEYQAHEELLGSASKGLSQSRDGSGDEVTDRSRSPGK